MAREKAKRIATAAGPEAWTSPFASLDVPAARLGPEIATPAPTRNPSPVPPSGDRLLMRRETAHRGGKTVIVLEGFSPAWSPERLEMLLHELKSALGCGGRTEPARLELQGELADRLHPLLEAKGFRVKRGW